MLRSEIEKINITKEYAKLLIIKYYYKSSSFPEVCSLLIILLTIHVTIVIAEQLFSN